MKNSNSCINTKDCEFQCSKTVLFPKIENNLILGNRFIMLLETGKEHETDTKRLLSEEDDRCDRYTRHQSHHRSKKMR